MKISVNQNIIGNSFTINDIQLKKTKQQGVINLVAFLPVKCLNTTVNFNSVVISILRDDKKKSIKVNL